MQQYVMNTVSILGIQLIMKHIFFLTLFILLNGCVSYYPRDLQLVSMKVVDYKYQSELSVPQFQGVFKQKDPYWKYLNDLYYRKGDSTVTKEEINKYFLGQQQNKFLEKLKKNKLLLKIVFRSKENIAKFVYSEGLSFGIDPYFCDQKFLLVHWGYPIVYWKGIEISSTYNIDAKEDQHGFFNYYAYVDIFENQSLPKSSRYEFNNSLGDLCFRLHGGSFGSNSKSNKVKISADNIRKMIDSSK